MLVLVFLTGVNGLKIIPMLDIVGRGVKGNSSLYLQR